MTLIKQVEKEPDELLKYLKNKLGCGGTVHGSTVEIQGDHTEVIKGILLENPDRLRDVKLPKKEPLSPKEGGDEGGDESGRVRRKPRHAKPEEKAPAAAPVSVKRPTGPIVNSKPRCPCDWLYCSGWYVCSLPPAAPPWHRLPPTLLSPLVHKVLRARLGG